MTRRHDPRQGRPLGRPRVKSLDIAVVTRRCEVQLSGFVDGQAQIDRAIELARGVDGVDGVNHVGNNMSIKMRAIP